MRSNKDAQHEKIIIKQAPCCLNPVTLDAYIPG
jgi:hypothetical protein